MAILIIIFLPLAAALLSLSVRKSAKALNVIALIAAAAELATVFFAVSRVIVTEAAYPFLYFSLDHLGAIVLVIVAVVGLSAAWYSTGYLRVEMEKEIIGFHRVRQYFILLHLFIFAMFFAILTTNPILTWIAIEATTLSTAFLISFYNKPSAIEAAWKYLMINSVGLLLAFFGTLLFLYPSLGAGEQGLVSWASLSLHAGLFDPFVAKIAFIFILIGYGTKVGLVPMHTWLPDAHSKAPVPISGLLSGVLLNVALLAVLRFKVVADLAIGPDFSQGLFIFFGVISIVVAAFIIYIQKNYKRMLAYSSIEHMGIILLGFGFGGLGISAAILHMIYHSLAKSILFLSAGNIFLKYSSTKIMNVRGAAKILPATKIFFAIGFLAITGLPPFGMFFTEFLILSAGIKGHLAVTAIVLAALTLVFAGFLKHVSHMLFGQPDKEMTAGENGRGTVAPIAVLVVTLAIASLCLPSYLDYLINASVLMF